MLQGRWEGGGGVVGVVSGGQLREGVWWVAVSRVGVVGGCV